MVNNFALYRFHYIITATLIKPSQAITASQQAKKAGFKSLREVAELINKKPKTLNNWFNDNKLLFDSVLIGLAIKLKEEGDS